MPAKVHVNDKKLRDIQKEVEIFKNSFVSVGLHEGETPYPDGLTVADVGFFNEFGTENIPERSWIRSWFDANRRRIEKKMEQLYKAVLDGKMKAKRALMLLGNWAQSEIRKTIIDLRSPPNAPSTIIQKGSSNPLIDTGQMMNTVRFEVHVNSSLGKVNNL